jgi:hypothetical protein
MNLWCPGNIAPDYFLLSAFSAGKKIKLLHTAGQKNPKLKNEGYV